MRRQRRPLVSGDEVGRLILLRLIICSYILLITVERTSDASSLVSSSKTGASRQHQQQQQQQHQLQQRQRSRARDRNKPADFTSRRRGGEQQELSDAGGAAVWSRRQIPDEQRLMRHLLENYDTASRPVFNASHTVVVKFGLTLAQIADMDEVNQVLTTIVWFEQEWEDERLKWDPREYNNLTTIRVPCHRIWLPDIVLYNSADDFTAGLMQSKAMVTHTGTVFWPPPAKLRSSCKIDITYFPFDDQKCRMKFGSWTYDGFQVDVMNRSAVVDLANYIFSGEWQLLSITVKRNEVQYACCIEPYPDVTFTIVIRRRTLYYLFNIIFPCLWLTVLSLLGFWLPPDSGEKITLGITVLLAFSVFMLMIAENMPATSEFVPLMGIYLTITMGMTSLSIILTVFVLQLYHVTPQQHPVPDWLRGCVLGCIAPALRMHDTIEGFRCTYVITTSQDDCNDGGSVRPQSCRLSRMQTATTDDEINELQYASQKSNRGQNGLMTSSTSTGTRQRLQEVESDASLKRLRLQQSGTNQLGGGSGQTTVSVERALKIVVERSQGVGDSVDYDEQLRRTIVNEWKLVALVMDRLLFILFLIISTLSTVAILVILPLTKPSMID